MDSSGYPGVASGRWPRHVQPLGVRHGDRRGIEGPLYYIYPPGSSLLSAPAVWIANRFGVSLVDPANRYQERLEVHLQTLLAAGLMAVATGIFYLVSRLYVGGGWSLAIATWGAVGTSIWSTASRGLWSHTWDVLLLALAILHLSRVEARSGRLAPIWLATLLSWGYVVRPTAIFYIGPLVLYETSNRQPTARRPR